MKNWKQSTVYLIYLHWILKACELLTIMEEFLPVILGHVRSQTMPNFAMLLNEQFCVIYRGSERSWSNDADQYSPRAHFPP